MSDAQDEMHGFSQSVIEQIGYYVYLLIDPRDNSIFYVGKGTSNRVFAHLADAISSPNENDKLTRIRAIRSQGKEVQHVILRHGLTEREAFEIEASSIDLCEMLEIRGTNQVAGHESLQRGIMSARDIMAQYDARSVTINEPMLLIKINRLFQYGISPERLYEITRGNWNVGEQRNKIKYACAVYKGIVREVYEVHRWFQVDTQNPAQKIQHRWRFDGHIAHELQHYVGGSVKRYVKGTQNPIRYINCE